MFRVFVVKKAFSFRGRRGVKSALFDLLDAAGIFLTFDTETGEIPVGHDKLLLDFAAASGGAFKPEACHEKMLQKNDEDSDAPYAVQFIHGGRLYRFTARNFSDWYDVERVVLACNRALADAGSAKQVFPDRKRRESVRLARLRHARAGGNSRGAVSRAVRRGTRRGRAPGQGVRGERIARAGQGVRDLHVHRGSWLFLTILHDVTSTPAGLWILAGGIS